MPRVDFFHVVRAHSNIPPMTRGGICSTTNLANLTTKIDGITKSRHIPKDLLPAVKRMTRRHKKLKELLKELEQTNWLLIREGEELRSYGTV